MVRVRVRFGVRASLSIWVRKKLVISPSVLYILCS